VLPGCTNYREVLLTLPTGGPSTINAMSDAELRALIMRNDGNADVDGVSRADLLAMISSMDMSSGDLAKLTGKNTAQYKSGHWDQPNVLAHIRVNDRTDAEGRRVLFVEEIQSDWGQAAKKYGMVDASRRATKAEAKGEGSQLYYEVTDAQGRFITNVYGTSAENEAAAIAEANRRIRENPQSTSVQNAAPRAPFVDKTDKWVTLALKRIVKMAVDEGYDRVAFVTGEQSAERYDLSKHVDQVSYSDDGILRAFQGRKNVLTEKAPPEKIEDHIGKEVAKRLLEAPMEDGRRVLMGESLKVGGEGMKAFYDKIVPSVLKDVLRKVGGGQISQTDLTRFPIDYRTEPATASKSPRYRAQTRIVVANDNDTRDKFWHGSGWSERSALAMAMTPEEADAKVAELRRAQTLQQPGFDITPEMREAAAGGMPMFSMAPRQSQTDTPEFKRWFGDSKVVDAQGRPLVVYHGGHGEISSFDRPTFFSNLKEYAETYEKGAVYEAFLSIHNPLEVDANCAPFD